MSHPKERDETGKRARIPLNLLHCPYCQREMTKDEREADPGFGPGKRKFYVCAECRAKGKGDLAQD